MSTGVIITLIICGTIVVLVLITTIANVFVAKKATKHISKVAEQINKEFETPEKEDFFKPF